MLKLVFLIAGIVCAFGAVVPEGMLPQWDGRIVNGDPARISAFPWQVSLQRGGSHFCGGSVYSQQIIVTAAHCLQFIPDVSVLKVRAGSSFWISGGVLVGVASFSNHERYNPNTMEYDIAVIRLRNSLAFSPTIKPIRLASIAPDGSAAAVVSGWGTTKFGSNTVPSQLKYVNMKILSRQECASSTYNYSSLEIRKTMICTYGVNKDSCQGDSGGPLVSGGALVGVVSWGNGCAFAGYPGVYTDVADLRSWVINTASFI